MSSTPVQQTVRLTLLGGFRLEVGSVPVTVRESGQRMIAYIALQDRPVRRDRLASSLWLDKPDARAAANLRSALWRVREQGADIIDVDGSSLRLSECVNVDVREATARAWRVIDGRVDEADLDQLVQPCDLLTDWYDEWVIIERERLHQLHLHALEGLCRSLLDSGRVARAVDSALALMSVDPLRESGHKLLIEAHVQEGNWAGVIRCSRRYVDTMLEQLGLDVSDRLSGVLPDRLVPQVLGLRTPSPRSHWSSPKPPGSQLQTRDTSSTTRSTHQAGRRMGFPADTG